MDTRRCSGPLTRARALQRNCCESSAPKSRFDPRGTPLSSQPPRMIPHNPDAPEKHPVLRSKTGHGLNEATWQFKNNERMSGPQTLMPLFEKWTFLEHPTTPSLGCWSHVGTDRRRPPQGHTVDPRVNSSTTIAWPPTPLPGCLAQRCRSDFL